MFVPGHNERLMSKSAESEADALIFDIEDSVVPASNKQVARDLIRQKLETGIFDRFEVFCRINDRESGHLLKDVSTLAIGAVNGFVYPKARAGEDIYFFDKLLETIEYEKGLPVGTFSIVPLIETTAAVLAARDICLASGRVLAIAYGCEDFVSDLEGIHDKEGQSLFTPRAMIAMAARASGVIPIDTVHVNVHDLEDLEENIRLARRLGFEGMLVLHPKELEIVHKHFTPTKEEVDEATEMLRLAEEAGKQDKGVVIMNGRFVGPPMVLAAQQIIRRAMLIERKLSDR
ncbi:MAG: CoA ester lyase [Candidatus Krumholzibacteriota bacterium]|nr:CoA ester lyase [Candidatus Krumholzibacteriota bacterium]